MLKILSILMGITFSPLLFVNVVVAQESTASATLSAQPIVQPQPTRDQLYDELKQEAALVEKQYRLIKKLIQTVQPTVAHIEAKKRQASEDNDGKSRRVLIEEAGAGIVIQYRGRPYIITNFHVVENSAVNDIRIESDGILYYPTRVINDRLTDLSVLVVEKRGLTPARLGSSEKAEIGDFVVAVGSPFGLSHSVSYGIISALNRHDLELGPQGVKYQDFIQTDAAINPGNSGGPLMNLRGEVIGINTAIASNSGGNDGIGFAIPINMVMRIVSDLIDYGEVKRGFLGVSLDSAYGPEKARRLGIDRSYGARVTSITPNSPAAVSKLEINDVILNYDNHRIMNDSHLVTSVSLTTIGKKIPLQIFRRGQLMTLYVDIHDRRQFNR